MANFGVPGTGDAGAGTGGGVNTQCPPPPESGLNKRPREPGGDIKREDAAEAETTKVPSIVENSVLVEAETPLISVPESVVPVSAPAKRTFEVTAENAMKSVAAVVVVGLLISFVSSAIKKK